jgi:two-component system sensor kinase FixL
MTPRRPSVRDSLRDREARLAAVLAATVDGIVACDDAGVIEMFNPAAEAMFGYHADEVVGGALTVLMPDPHRSQHDGHMRSFLQRGTGKVTGMGRELVGQRKDGTTFPLEVSLNASLVDGRYLFTAVVRDVTTRNAAERELREAHAELEQANHKLVEEQGKLLQAEKLSSIGLLASGVAHEINNPLSGLMGAVRALRRGTVGPDRRDAYFEAIDGGLARIAQTVRGLLDYARQRPPAVTEVDPAEAVSAAILLVTPAANKKCLEIANRTRLGSHVVQADRGQLMQALVNVLLNAIQASPQRAALTATVVERPGWVGMRVEDAGPGIPADIADKVCDPFFTTKPEGQGTGLGLSITLGIVRAHDGEIEVATSDLGGAAVSLWLPHRPRRNEGAGPDRE